MVLVLNSPDNNTFYTVDELTKELGMGQDTKKKLKTELVDLLKAQLQAQPISWKAILNDKGEFTDKLLPAKIHDCCD